MSEPTTCFGAKSFYAPDNLVPTQRVIFDYLVRQIPKIAVSAVTEQGSFSDTPQDQHSYYNRPRHVFVIDGGRGMGKTTLLLTLHQYLSNTEKKKNTNPGKLLILPIMRPDEMEGKDNTMECIFAHINNELSQRCKTDENPSHADFPCFGPNPEKNRCKKLEQELHTSVQTGWAYSQAHGVEMLHRDSVDYLDYVRNRAVQAGRSYTRVIAWRKFVDHLLDGLGCQALVLCIDDTDLSPQIGQDILHAIRIYFCHPRIITLLCVDMDALIHGQEILAAQRRAEATDGLPSVDTEFEWFNRDSKDIEEYLYKILPAPYRLRIRFDKEAIDQIVRYYTAGRSESFLEYCTELMHKYPDEPRFTLWWIAHQKAETPFASIRDLQSFVMSTNNDGYQTDLMEALIRPPDLFRLRRALNLRASDPICVPELLASGQISHTWGEQRDKQFIVNEEHFIRGHKGGYQALRLFLDREIAQNDYRPDWRSWGQVLPRLWDLKSVPPDLTALYHDVALGVAHYYRDQAYLPLNCLYFSDLVVAYNVYLNLAEKGTLSGGISKDWAAWFESNQKKLKVTWEESSRSNQKKSKVITSEEPSFPEAFFKMAGWERKGRISRRFFECGSYRDGYYLYPRLWLIKVLRDGNGNKKISVPDLEKEIKNYNTAIDESPDTDFVAFIQEIQVFYREIENKKAECRNLMLLALEIAGIKTKGTSLFHVGRLNLSLPAMR